jgi:light-regulated signal transduction histidine kinase (bacteriophytochrome)
MNRLSARNSARNPETIIRLLHEELTATNREVLALTLELEQRVADRTAQLLRANQELSQEVAERKRAEEEVRKLNQDLAQRAALLEEANHELEAFSYSVSHDLRTPLRSISGFSHVLLKDYADRLDVEGKEYLRNVIDSAERMGRLIDSLLNLSRVSRADLQRKRVCLSAVVHAIAARLQAAEPARRVDFQIQEELFEQADPHLLAAALENLIGNAWKFTSKRAVARIEFGMEPGKDPAVYFVRDNGAGFNPAYAEKLFGVFQRLHSIEEFEGTGIGLATVQRIVRRHGGRVWAAGDLDRGATFYFTLQQEER